MGRLFIADEALEPSQRTETSSGDLVGRAIANIRAAVALLTRLPVRDHPAATGSRAFPIVGAVIGVAGFVPIVVLGSSVPSVGAILAIACMAVLSGGLHLDGLADTADALIAAAPDAAERARKDPRIGAGGVSALLLVLGLEAASLTTLIQTVGAFAAGMGCVLAASASRAVPVVLGRMARGAAAGTGLGAWFAGRITTRDGIVAIVLGATISIAGMLVAPTLVSGIVGIAGLIAGVGLGLVLVRARGQLDGDVLGASVELAFASALVVAAGVAAAVAR